MANRPSVLNYIAGITTLVALLVASYGFVEVFRLSVYWLIPALFFIVPISVDVFRGKTRLKPLAFRKKRKPHMMTISDEIRGYHRYDKTFNNDL